MFLKIFFCFFVMFLILFFDGKSVMPMFCNAMLLLLYVHVCVTRTGWKTRPRPKTVILLIKQSINQSINQSLSSLLSCPSIYFITALVSPITSVFFTKYMNNVK